MRRLPRPGEVWWLRVLRALDTAPRTAWGQRLERTPDGAIHVRPQEHLRLLGELAKSLEGRDEGAQLLACDRLGEHLSVGPHPHPGPRALEVGG